MALAGGGYDYDFLDNPPPDRLTCPICHLPCRDPQLSLCCGHNFCKTDIESFKKASPDVNEACKCPICRGKFESCINQQACREINDLRIYCPNRSAGCDWVGEVKKVKAHRENNAECLFEMLECPHGCGSEHQRQNLTSHIEVHCTCYCQYCKTTADKEVISNQHKEKCKKYPTLCPNECGKTGIPYEKIEKHREECPLELVDCLFSDVGCEGRMARKDREDHNTNNIEKHLQLSKIHISNMRKGFAEAMAASEQRYEKLHSTLDEVIKDLQTKITLDELRKEQTRNNNMLALTVDQKTIEAKQDAKTNLVREVNKLTNGVQRVKTEVANCKESIRQNENNLGAMRDHLNDELAAVNRAIREEIHRSIFTYKNFILVLLLIVVVLVIPILIARTMHK